MFTSESPHRGDSNEYTQQTIFNIKKKITLNFPKSTAMGSFPRNSKNEFETAMVNEPSLYEPSKFQYMSFAERLRSAFIAMLQSQCLKFVQMHRMI